MKNFYSYFVRLSVLALFVSAFTGVAGTSHAQSISIESDLNSEIQPRMKENQAEVFITNKEEIANLVIHGDRLLIQFTDTYLENIERELQEKEETVFAEVIKSMVGSGIRTLLDNAISFSIYDIKEVSYSNGTLKIVDFNNKSIFDDLEINGTYIMQDFSMRDARRFVAEAEKRLI